MHHLTQGGPPVCSNEKSSIGIDQLYTGYRQRAGFRSQVAGVLAVQMNVFAPSVLY
jgi:hypothetical protein